MKQQQEQGFLTDEEKETFDKKCIALKYLCQFKEFESEMYQMDGASAKIDSLLIFIKKLELQQLDIPIIKPV